MNKGLFIMLDNVLITTRSGKPFPLHSEDWKFKVYWQEIMKQSILQGFTICIIDNQYDVGKNGYIPSSTFNNKIENICKIIEKDLDLPQNSVVSNFCFEEDTFHSVPKPGLIYDLALDYELNLGDSILIGDMETHVLLAKNAGISTYYDINDII